MEREIAKWWQGTKPGERRFIYLREITRFEISIPREDLSLWRKDFPVEELARAEIEKIKDRAGGEWVHHEPPPPRSSS